MKIFESKKAGNLFKSLFDEMTIAQRYHFSNEVKGLFDKKQVSPEGAFDVYKVTESDLLEIAKSISTK